MLETFLVLLDCFKVPVKKEKSNYSLLDAMESLWSFESWCLKHKTTYSSYNILCFLVSTNALFIFRDTISLCCNSFTFEHLTKTHRTVKLDEKAASYRRKFITVNLALILPQSFSLKTYQLGFPIYRRRWNNCERNISLISDVISTLCENWCYMWIK